MVSPTMKSFRIQILSLLLVGLAAQPTHAEVIPGRWEKVSNLDLGTSITLELKSGNRLEGYFHGLSESEVDIETHSVRASIPRAVIQTITTRTQDRLGDGAAIGTALGAIAWVVLAFIGQGWTDSDSREAYLPAVPIGAGLRVAVDAYVKSRVAVLYKAPGTP